MINFFSVMVSVLVSLIAGIELIFLSLDGLNLFGIGLDSELLSPVSLLQDLQLLLNQDILIRWAVGLIGFLILLMSLRFLQGFIFKIRKEKSIKFETDDGNVSITLSALENMIRKSLEAEELVSNIRPRVSTTKKAMIVDVKMTLKNEINFHDFGKTMQAKIKDKLQIILGSDKDLKININVGKISFAKKGAVVDDDVDDEEGPFRKY